MENLKQFKEYVIDWEDKRTMRDGDGYVFAYGMDGLKLWIERALRRENQRLLYEGLGKNYGHELHRLMGRTLNDNLVSLVMTSVTETLCANPYIRAVSLKEYAIEGSRLTHDQTRYIFENNTIGFENEAVNVDDVIQTANH